MALFRGPKIVTDGLVFAVDAGSERSYPRNTLDPSLNVNGLPAWVDYGGGLAAGRYSILNNVQPYSILLNTTYNSWVGSFYAYVISTYDYTIVFDYVTTSAGTLILDNDGVNDNNWNATINASTTVQTYSVTKSVTGTGAMNFYLRRNSGGDITISNFRFFKTSPVLNIVENNTGTLNNGVSLDNANGSSFVFDGVDDYIEFPNYSAHQSTTGTIEAWVKIDNLTGNRYIFGIGGTTTYGASRALRINGGNFSVVTYGSSTQDWNSITAATTDWTHVAMGWSGTTLYFYLNGYYRLSVLRTGVVTPLGSVFRIGMPPWSVSAATDGQIASVRHYSIALTEDQMRQNFNAQKSRFGL
tara:strand:+ start:385 stop:1452 length:1068 start_codon:yes stop_codon:yes gene_type:complete